MATKAFKVDDRVKRASGTGCAGVIKDVREETMATKVETPQKSMLVNVLWDNGTLSYVSPEAIVHADSK